MKKIDVPKGAEGYINVQTAHNTYDCYSCRKKILPYVDYIRINYRNTKNWHTGIHCIECCQKQGIDWEKSDRRKNKSRKSTVLFFNLYERHGHILLPIGTVRHLDGTYFICLKTDFDDGFKKGDRLPYNSLEMLIELLIAKNWTITPVMDIKGYPDEVQKIFKEAND